MQQPLTEETGKALVLAMRDLTEAIKRGSVLNVSAPDGAYVARSVLGVLMLRLRKTSGHGRPEGARKNDTPRNRKNGRESCLVGAG